MYELCFMSGMDSSEIAAWVQAVGSILAIVAAAGIAIYQAKKQHESAMEVYKTEKRHAQIELAKTLGMLANSCKNAVDCIASKIKAAETIESIATGKEHLDLTMLKSLEHALESVPLISLPANFVSEPLILHGSVRQFRENVEHLLENWCFTNKDEYQQALKVINEIRGSLEITCDTIFDELKRIRAEA